jgi:tRNA/rRNA methyltransferase
MLFISILVTSSMNNIKIILVEPAGALNIGSVARVMKNMGLSQLVLVNPKGDRRSEEAKRMAVHGIEVLDNALHAESLPEALSGCTRAIATTNRPRNLSTNLETPKNALPWLLAENTTTALIFGPEDRGLSNSELNHAQRFVGIPAHPEYSSLNLAQAVAVCCYELYQAYLDKTAVPENPSENSSYGETEIEAAPLDELEGYYRHLAKTLLEIKYLYPHTSAARMEKFRRFYNRANLNREELAMLRGILRQVEWAIANQYRQ